MLEVRVGARLIHTAPDGCKAVLLAGQAALAIVAGSGTPSYYVFSDGSTKPVTPAPVDGDPLPGQPGRGMVSDYDPI